MSSDFFWKCWVVQELGIVKICEVWEPDAVTKRSELMKSVDWMLLLLASGSSVASGYLCVATGSTVASSAEITTQSLPAESLAQEQNAVVSTYVNDIVLLSSSADCTVACDWISSTTSLPLASGMQATC
ncbi:hypothetical protein F511_27831 [Dorcoceras hygrometricum]|uniref:Uncharacterized protein n=1 Tax=Dorcoceras hygrometricum TaxID=472368 RepID=A0A2Z7BYT5_9LAMI|nr:hypothetical protein F511_27831 [Dorcoceras hygrometricum]